MLCLNASDYTHYYSLITDHHDSHYRDYYHHHRYYLHRLRSILRINADGFVHLRLDNIARQAWGGKGRLFECTYFFFFCFCSSPSSTSTSAGSLLSHLPLSFSTHILSLLQHLIGCLSDEHPCASFCSVSNGYFTQRINLSPFLFLLIKNLTSIAFLIFIISFLVSGLSFILAFISITTIQIFGYEACTACVFVV